MAYEHHQNSGEEIDKSEEASATMSSAPLVCQRCKQPLRIHESLADISPAAFDLLAGAHPRSFSSPPTFNSD